MTGIGVTSLRVKGRDLRFSVALVFPAIFLFLFYAGISAAQEESGQYITETQQMELADQFFREGDYEGAIREYKRFLFFYPRSNRTEEALLKNARSYFRGQKWEEALSACDHLVNRNPAPLVKSEAFRIQRGYNGGEKAIRGGADFVPAKPVRPLPARGSRTKPSSRLPAPTCGKKNGKKRPMNFAR